MVQDQKLSEVDCQVEIYDIILREELHLTMVTSVETDHFIQAD